MSPRETNRGSHPSEAHIVGKVVSHLRQLGYNVRTEVPNMGQTADIVATRNRWVTVIEAKRHDWKRAIAQCLAHEHVADFICVAIGTSSVSKELVTEARAVGYGVIHCAPVASHCRWVVLPERNTNVWSPQRRRLSSALRQINYEH